MIKWLPEEVFLRNYFEETTAVAIPLEELIIPKPGDKVFINRLPYQLMLDAAGYTALQGATKFVHAKTDSRSYSPNKLAIHLTEELSIKALDETTPEPFYDYKRQEMCIKVPCAVFVPDKPAEELAQRVEWKMSQDILKALHMAVVIKEELSRWRFSKAQNVAQVAAKGLIWAAKKKIDPELEAFFDQPPILLLQDFSRYSPLWAARDD